MASGVLDASTQATYTDTSQVNWVYYLDADKSGTFYITPIPAFSVQNNKPGFHLTEYVDNKGNFLSGTCQITTHLQVPQTVQTAVQGILQQQGIANPSYQAMPYIDITNNPQSLNPFQAYLSYASADGLVSRTVNTEPSGSGDQIAMFQIDYMTQTEVNFFKTYFGGDTTAGTIWVSYRLVVIAHLNGVTAEVHFDSQAAWEYQQTFKWVS